MPIPIHLPEIYTKPQTRWDKLLCVVATGSTITLSIPPPFTFISRTNCLVFQYCSLTIGLMLLLINLVPAPTIIKLGISPPREWPP
ncbi:hypothetical protein BDZ91DRAFT_458942 [Kalaharituber pfeilii]|nr:hypothetical protein BDZ91DRAFT_458942 [Kalaharituber pfeilii]